MPPQPIPALLLGDPGRLPFVGHFRCVTASSRAVLAIAGRVAGDAGIEAAHFASRQAVLSLRLAPPPDADRHELLRLAWAALAETPEVALGPLDGTDLTMLLVSQDADGVGVAGVGLSAVWARTGTQMRTLVPPRHPLLAPPGLPQSTPGVLTLPRPVDALVGCPYHLSPPDLHNSDVPQADLDAACGVHR